MIPVTKPISYINQLAARSISDLVVSDGLLTNNGPNVREFSTRIADLTGARFAYPVCNGTIALFVALKALNLRNGDVLVPSFTFPATVNAVVECGLRPVFFDIDPVTTRIDVESLRSSLTQETVAVVGVNCFGFDCGIDEVGEFCKQHDIKLIIDAAHYFLAGCEGRWQSVEKADVWITSFHATKVISCVEGGAVFTNCEQLSSAVKLYCNFSSCGQDIYLGSGLNAKMSEVSAIFGLSHLEHWPSILSERERVWRQYVSRLGNNENIIFLKPQSLDEWNYAYCPIRVDSQKRDSLKSYLERSGICARRYFYPLVSDIYEDAEIPFSSGSKAAGSQLLASEILCLPIFPELTNQEVDFICSNIAKFFELEIE